MYCQYCGSPLDDGTRFCTNCGAAQPAQARAPQPQPQAQPQQPIIVNVTTQGNQAPYQEVRHVYVRRTDSTKGRLVTLLLCLFLGGFGVHRFYVGKVGTGLLWMLTGGLCGIGWFVDLISIACGGFTDSQGLRV